MIRGQYFSAFGLSGRNGAGNGRASSAAASRANLVPSARGARGVLVAARAMLCLMGILSIALKRDWGDGVFI